MSEREATQNPMAQFDTDDEASISKMGITLAPPSKNEPEVIQRLRAKGYVFEIRDKAQPNETRNPM